MIETVLNLNIYVQYVHAYKICKWSYIYIYIYIYHLFTHVSLIFNLDIVGLMENCSHT